MELRHLRYFVAVAEEEHFARAAARLHISAPPLSQQIRDLERELGVSLFERVGRRVRLTPAGRALREDAINVLAEVDRSVRRVQAAARGDYGHLALAFAETGSLDLVPRFALRFRERHPDVELELLPMPIHTHIDALRAREITAAVTFGFGEPADADISSQVMYTQRMGLIMSRDHPLAARQRIESRLLAGQPFVWARRDTSPIFHDYVSARMAERGLHLRVAVRTTTWEARLSLVASGAGITFGGPVQDLEARGLVYRPLTDVRVDITSLLIWRREDDRSRLLLSVREILSDLMVPARRRRAVAG
ncbi:MAG: LysR family transcriptional regulator [Acidimicrobiia bacterium]|nr:LysR family transcriptional regulator [Acidimicrobiia bacterium]